MTHNIGTIVGDTYKLKELIGRGGMGYVFRAEHTIIGRDYALKLMDPDQINEVNWKRFQAEGKAIAKLNHINIVSIYNMGVDGDRSPYYVMDLLQGESLAEHIHKSGPPPLAVTLEIFSQLCSALSYAHSVGVIHRDLKPSNIILADWPLRPFDPADRPTVKIVDFGIAKLLRIGDDSIQRLTGTGEIFGTPLYMSPEQCMGSITDQRSDIYSLGCTLYESLTGVPPLVGKNAMETVLMHLEKGPLPLSQVYPQGAYLGSLELLVDKMLRKNPQERYQNMAQVGHDLERLKSGKDVVLRKNESLVFSKSTVDAGERTDARMNAGTETANTRPVPNWLVPGGVATAALLVILSFFGAQTFYKNSQPVPKAATAATDGFLHSSEVVDEFKDVPKFSLGVQDVDGKPFRVFKFSDRVPVGELTWRGGHSLTYGKVYVPADLPLRLQLSIGNAEAVESDPTLLARFNDDDISELSLRTAFWPAVVKQVLGWRNLSNLTLGHTQLRDPDLPGLDKLTHLDELAIDNCSYNPISLSKLAILQRLKKVEFIGKVSIDEVLSALTASQRLTCLNVTRVPISSGSLNSIADIKNLTELVIPAYKLSDIDMKIFARMPNLRYLRLRRAAITPACISDLARLRQLKSLRFDALDWPEADLRRLKKLLPVCEFEDSKKLH